MESINEVNRVFDRRKFHYAGRIHEQIVCCSVFETNELDRNAHVMEESFEYDTYGTGLSFEHDGYNVRPEERKRKAARNATLLLKKVHTDDLYTYYQLGKSYYMADEAKKVVE